MGKPRQQGAGNGVAVERPDMGTVVLLHLCGNVTRVKAAGLRSFVGEVLVLNRILGALTARHSLYPQVGAPVSKQAVDDG